VGNLSPPGHRYLSEVSPVHLLSGNSEYGEPKKSFYQLVKELSKSCSGNNSTVDAGFWLCRRGI